MTVDAVRPVRRPRIGHSQSIQVKSQELLEFLRERFYRSPRVLEVMNDGAARIRSLFATLHADPTGMPEPYRERLERDGLERTICDYIAGMTDRFALAEHERIAG